MQIEVRNNQMRSRYEIFQDGQCVGVAEYREIGPTVVLPHTQISPERQGQGLGEQLVRGALDDLRDTGKKVIPACWFVAEYIEGHPEYRDLLVAA